MSRRNRYAPNNLDRPWHWTDDARCGDEEQQYAGLFFVEDVVGVIEAKEFCRPCPVRAQCLAGALDRREPYGVWGGLSVEERKVILAPVIAGERRAAAERKRLEAEAKERARADPVHQLELVPGEVPRACSASVAA